MPTTFAKSIMMTQTSHQYWWRIKLHAFKVEEMDLEFFVNHFRDDPNLGRAIALYIIAPRNLSVTFLGWRPPCVGRVALQPAGEAARGRRR